MMNDLQAENAWRRCVADQFYFYRQCLVRGKAKGGRSGTGLIPFDPYEWQIDLCNDIDNNDILGVLKARRIGFSEILRLKLLWHAITQPRTEIFVVSKTEKLAKRFVNSLKKNTWQSLPPWLMERSPELLNPRKGQYLEFDNGSLILSEAQGGEPARGETADFIFLDEFDFYEDSDSVWASCLEACDGGGKLVFGGTVKQPGRLFHQMWEKYEDGLTNYPMKFYGCFSIPTHDSEWYEKRKKEHVANPRLMFRENPRTPREAFMQSVANVFDQNVLRVAASRTREPWNGDLVWDDEEESFVISANEIGSLHIWDRPVPSDTYVIGADPARGLLTGDYSCAQVLCRQSGIQVAQWHGKVEADLFGSYMAALGEYYNNAYIGVESNHSTSSIDTLRRLRYPNIHRYISQSKVRQIPETKWGFYMTNASKNRIKDVTAGCIRAGARMIQREDGIFHIEDELPLTDDEIEARADSLRAIIMCKETKDEMSKFVFVNNQGKMEAKPHDDRVVSFMIACEMLRFVRESPNVVDEMPEKRVKFGSFEYMRQIFAVQQEELRRPQGGNSKRVFGKDRGGRGKRASRV